MRGSVRRWDGGGNDWLVEGAVGNVETRDGSNVSDVSGS